MAQASQNAGKCKRYKEKMKEKDPDYMRKERERIADIRKRQKETSTEEEKFEARRKERERKRRYREQREKKAESGDNSKEKETVTFPYKSPQSYGKAVQRLQRHLPGSPKKQKAVIHGLANRVGIRIQLQMERSLTGSHALSEEIATSVKEFYLRPDIVYTMPGMRDEIVIWTNGIKRRERKYFMTVFLREAYAIFKEVHPEYTIGFSKFCQLRPENVLLLHQTPADQCRCRIHENFFLRLKGLKIQYESESFWQMVLCDTEPNSKCWKVQCSDCSDGKKLQVELDDGTAVTWKQWDLVEKSDKKVLECVIHEGCAAELMELVKSDMDKVVRHIYTKRVQAQDFEDDKKSEARVLEMDFAMNYSCEYQSEVQSALWSRGSVMLYTAATFQNGTTETFMICSDSKDKGKNTVTAFIEVLYDHLISHEENPKEEIIWTDGPASEFKNRYMVQLLQVLSRKYNRNFTWKYYATSHGKGVVDGIGGRAKSLVRTAVMSKREDAPVVKSAKDFADVARQLLTKTTVFYLSQNDIDERVLSLNPWETEPGVIPGIQKIHVINHDLESGISRLWLHAMETAPTITLGSSAGIAASPDSNALVVRDLKVGEWCVVNYQGDQFPGEILELKGDEVKVSVMHRSGKHFKWPNPVDSIYYFVENIERKIKPPEAAGHRGQFIFPDY